MKAWLLSKEFAEIFEADVISFPQVGASKVSLRTELTSEEYDTPCVGFDVKVRALDGAGFALAYLLLLVVESNANDATDAEHADLVATVERKMFGVNAADVADAKAAMINAFAARGKFELRGYDSPELVDPAWENTRFRTVIPIAGIALLTQDV